MSQQLLKVPVTNVYERNARSKKRILVNIGGARSSKSHSIAQRIIEKSLNIPNRKIAVLRKTFPALRLTAYKLIVDLLSDYRIYSRLNHNKSDHTIINPANGSFLAFLSLDDPEKIKSTEWNEIWLEEANEFTWDDWIVLQTRLSAKTTAEHPNQIFLSLNPSDEQGWINQKLMLSPAFASQIELIESTYRDNPFLDSAYIELLEGLKEQDANAYRIYAEGKWSVLSHIIYEPYQLLNAYPVDIGEVIYGLDFGFNNPSALIQIGIQDAKNCYLRQLIYQTHLTNGQLIDKLKEVILPEHRRRAIYADTAEPARIEEIYKAGFNIHESDKDVTTGILFCKRRHYYTLAENIDLNKERGSYKWKQDKNGNVLDEPVKWMDHLMDAKRYALYTHFKTFIGPPAAGMSGGANLPGNTQWADWM